MTYAISKATLSLLKAKQHNFATCWKILRRDAVTLRFTDFHSPLFIPGDTTAYLPASGFSASARKNVENLDNQNLNVVGVITSSAITFADLIGGVYQDAKVTEYLVDYRFPFAGPVLSNVYWIKETKLTGETWSIELEGLTRWFNIPIGRSLDPVCGYDLGETACGINIVALTSSNVLVTTIDTQRKVFRASTLVGADGYYDYGVITWTGGNNIGRRSEIKSYVNTGKIVSLQLPTSFDITVGDEFSIYPGCNKTKAVCISKFSNIINFGGFPFIPGQNAVLKVPESK